MTVLQGPGEQHNITEPCYGEKVGEGPPMAEGAVKSHCLLPLALCSGWGGGGHVL